MGKILFSNGFSTSLVKVSRKSFYSWNFGLKLLQRQINSNFVTIHKILQNLQTFDLNFNVKSNFLKIFHIFLVILKRSDFFIIFRGTLIILLSFELINTQIFKNFRQIFGKL